MRYDILLFDADNTILDFDKAEEAAFRRALNENGLYVDDTILNTYRRNNIYQWQLFEQGIISKDQVLISRFTETFKELGMTANVDSIADLYEVYLHDGFAVVDNAREVLEELQKVCKLYLVTNGVLSIQESRMKGSDMNKYFTRQFVSQIVGYPKPRLEFFEYCFIRIDGFSKVKSLIIGDSLTSDVQGGINAGIDTCWFNPKHDGNVLGITPTYEIADLRQLYDIVK